MSVPTTHAVVYETIATAIESAGYTRDFRLLGNREYPSPLVGDTFRINPTGFEDSSQYDPKATGLMQIDDSITIHLADFLGVQQETAWLAARVRAVAALKAVIACDLQVTNLDRVDSQIDDAGTLIEHDLRIVARYTISMA